MQADGAVKKISNYITRKVGDKLSSLFKKDRKSFEEKWNDIKVVIEYGMLTEDKFYDKAESFNLYPTVDDKYFTYEELEKKIKKLQTDKDGSLIILYAQNKDEQYTYIESAKEKGYEVLLLDSPIIPHLMQKLESKKEKIKFSRVDSDTLENLIKKDEEVISKLTDEEKEKLKPMIETAVENPVTFRFEEEGIYKVIGRAWDLHYDENVRVPAPSVITSSVPPAELFFTLYF